MRTVLIHVEGAKRLVRKLQLSEGTRVSDILQPLNVPEGIVPALLSSDSTSYHTPLTGALTPKEHV